jgi:uncharacterized RDD family membrane protein YckC
MFLDEGPGGQGARPTPAVDESGPMFLDEDPAAPAAQQGPAAGGPDPRAQSPAWPSPQPTPQLPRISWGSPAGGQGAGSPAAEQQQGTARPIPPQGGSRPDAAHPGRHRSQTPSAPPASAGPAGVPAPRTDPPGAQSGPAAGQFGAQGGPGAGQVEPFGAQGSPAAGQVRPFGAPAGPQGGQPAGGSAGQVDPFGGLPADQVQPYGPQSGPGVGQFGGGSAGQVERSGAQGGPSAGQGQPFGQGGQPLAEPAAPWAAQVQDLARGEAGESVGVVPWRPVASDPFSSSQSQERPGGLVRRFAARVIDTVLLAALTGVAAVPLGSAAYHHAKDKVDQAKLTGVTVKVWLIDGTTGVQLGVVLAVFLLAGLLLEVLPTAKWGRTAGKKLVGLRVLDIEAQLPPGFGTSLRRWLTHTVLDLIAIGVVGLAWCLFDRPWKQCWHDKAARTFVAGT